MFNNNLYEDMPEGQHPPQMNPQQELLTDEQLMQEMMRKQQIYNQKQQELQELMDRKEKRKHLPKVSKSRLN